MKSQAAVPISLSMEVVVTIENDGATMFTVTISNLKGSTTPIAPGVWVVHGMNNPLFEVGMAGHLEMNSGYVSPLAPGAWAVHSSAVSPIFMSDQPDLGEGLEALAENGDPSALSAVLGTKSGVTMSGVFNTPSGASEPGVLLPGASYEFTFDAEEGDYLSFATMLVHTNDLFFSPNSMGISLFPGGTAISGDITSKVMLYDAGTEINELPGVGIHQPARLNGGDNENGNVRTVDDMFTYPSVTSAVKITITPM